MCVADGLGQAVLTLTVDDSQFKAGLQGAQRTAEGAAGGIQRVFSGLNQALSTMAGLAGVVGIGALTQQIVSTGKAAQAAEIQLRSLAGAYGETAAAQDAVARIQKVLGISANEASSDFAQLYAALRGTGLNLQQLEVLFVGVSNAARLSGAGAQEASAGLLQLKQGLASGRLQGDELRSVLEQLPALAQAIADEMGVSIGQLRQLGSDGKITSEIIFNAAKRIASAAAPGRAQVEQLGIAFENLKAQVAKGFGPAASEALTSISAGVIAFSRYVKDNSETLTNFGKGVVNLAKTLAPFAVGIMAVQAAMKAWALAAKAVAVAQAAVIALTGPKGWAVLAGAVAASAVAAKALEAGMKGVGDATAAARAEAEEAIEKFKRLLNETAPPPTAGVDEKDPRKALEEAAAIAKQNALFAIQLEQRQRQIAYAQQLGSVEEGAYRNALQRTQEIQESILQGRDQIRELGAAIDEARMTGVDPDSAGFQQLVNEQRLAAEDVKLKLVEGATALRDAGVQLRKDLDAGIREFTKVRSDPNGLNKYLSPQQRDQRAQQDFRLLLPQFRRSQGDFFNLTGQRAPEFSGPTAGVNAAMRDFIEAVQRERNAGKNVADIQAAIVTTNETLANVNKGLAEQVNFLANKDWNVTVNVAADGTSAAFGDVLAGAVS